MDALKEGQVMTGTFTIRVADGKGGYGDLELILQINGTNDRPVIQVVKAAPVTDEALVNGTGVTGTITGTDVDTGETALIEFSGGTVTATVGGTAVDPNGKWTYVRDPNLDINFMDPDTDYNETFTVTVTDENGDTEDTDTVLDIQLPVIITDDTGEGGEQTVTIKVCGAPNTAPTNPTGFTGNVTTEDALQSTQLTGTLSATDTAPLSYSLVEDQSNQGLYGNLLLNPNGSWTYTPNAAFRALTLGQLAQESFTVRVTDDRGAVVDKTFTLDVIGTGNVITVTAADSTVDVGDTSLVTTLTPAGGTGPYTHAAVGETNGLYGTFAINAAGQVTYTLYPGLDTGFFAEQDYTEYFTITVTDSAGLSREITVPIIIDGAGTAALGDGLNDAPQLNGVVQNGAFDPNASELVALTGQLQDYDPDEGASLRRADTRAGSKDATPTPVKPRRSSTRLPARPPEPMPWTTRTAPSSSTRTAGGVIPFLIQK